jgi:phospholipase C
VVAALAVTIPLMATGGASASSAVTTSTKAVRTSPIKHLVVIFQENVSFDHYFGTYPDATNTSGQPFYPKPVTANSTVNGLTSTLLTTNPNGVNPRRLDPSDVNDVLVCDQNHDYTPEQQAFDNGLMDKFPASVGTSTGTSPTGQTCKSSDVMNYYDGNTVTGLWNYAQNFSMSDNFFGTTFGPSAPGAVNLVSGDTGTVDTAHSVRGALTDGDVAPDGTGGFSLISDAQPYYDDCSSRDAVGLSGLNIGDLLNRAKLSWGWFQGGFTANSAYSGATDTASTYNQLNEPGRATCTTSHNVGVAVGGTGQYGTKADYIPHHEPFQYYASTANPHHLAPTSLSVVGTDTATPGEFNTANHQYDTSTFDQLVAAIKAKTLSGSHLPAVSFLKAPGYEDGHAAYSDPLDEQKFVTDEINSLEQLPTWKSTAVVVTYDDSDGFYDHVYSGVTNPSQTSADALTGTNQCGTGTTYLGNEQGRCGYGPRLPLLVISPYAQQDDVSHTLTDQSSVTKFIEDNWSLGQIPGSAANVAGSLDDLFDFQGPKAPKVFLDNGTGQQVTATGAPVPVVGTVTPSTGEAGTTVTIAGINLSTSATTIRFGKKDATSVICSSDTSCTATVPSQTATTVPVTAEVNGVKSDSQIASFTYGP